MFITVRRLTLVAVAAVLLPLGFDSAEAGKTVETKVGMSGEMVLFLLDAGMSDEEIDILMELGVQDDEIMLLYGLSEKDLASTKGVSGLDLGSGRIKSFGETSGESPSNF